MWFKKTFFKSTSSFSSLRGFTVIEIVLVIAITGVLAVMALPKFMDMSDDADNARADGNIGALRGAADIYYSKTVLSDYAYLCTASGNPFRTVTVPKPCYPANIEELESLLSYPLDWGDGGGGECYDSATGIVGPCS